MREKPSRVLENCRITAGPFASDSSYGMTGAFVVLFPGSGRYIKIISSDGEDLKLPALDITGGEGRWEHVSASLENRPPNWAEMCFVKNLFWDEEECVVQYHPPASKYVNCHPHCLHLWKPIGIDVPTPPHWMVGPRIVAA